MHWPPHTGPMPWFCKSFTFVFPPDLFYTCTWNESPWLLISQKWLRCTQECGDSTSWWFWAWCLQPEGPDSNPALPLPSCVSLADNTCPQCFCFFFHKVGAKWDKTSALKDAQLIFPIIILAITPKLKKLKIVLGKILDASMVINWTW